MSEAADPAPVDPVADESDPVTVADKPREPTPYEVRLRRENATSRSRLREVERERDTARQAIEAARTERETAIEAARTAARTEANERIVRAELKAAALSAGMVDLDGLKLLDLSGVKLDDRGDVAIPDGFFARAKEAKPYLFGTARTTSVPAEPPRAEPPVEKSAKDMTPAELSALARKLGIRV